MRKTTLDFSAAMVAAIALTAAAAPEGYDNAAGYWVDGIFNVSPFVNLHYYRDDNPNSLRKSGKDRARARGLSKQLDDADVFVIKGGMNFLMPGNHWRLDGRAYYYHENYSGIDIDDRNDYLERFTLKGWTDANTTWYVTESFQDIRYDDEFELSKDDRKLFFVGAGGDLAVSDKSKIIVGAGYRDYSYAKNSHYDYSRLHGSFGFAHQLTEKTDWTLSATYRTYDRDGYDKNAYAANGKLGLRTRSTDKLTFDTGVGVEYYRDYRYSEYDAAGNYLGKRSKGKDDTSFVYHISGTWKIVKRLSLRVSGYSEYEPAQDVNDNSLLENTISTVLTYKPGDHWNISAGVAYERDEYTRKVAPRIDSNGNPYAVDKGGRDRNDDDLRYFANVAYAINRFCSVSVNWRYTNVNSSVENYDYERTRYGAGVSLHY